MATVLLGITGSIAAYKACELARLLVKSGHDIHVLMTRSATRFVSELTFRTLSRNPVIVDLFDEPEAWVPGHISLAERANLLIIAPCTANVLAKLACGLADDMLTATALATKAPLIIAPAMNTGMWEHPATQTNIATLLSHGVQLINTETGELACGSSGKGRMAEADIIFKAAQQVLRQT